LLKPPRNEKEGAWIGIGGPVAGVGATVCIHALGIYFKAEDLLDAAAWGYMVHLFNLIPAGNLDGGHIAGFLARWMWVPGMVCLAVVLHFLGGLNWASKLLFGLCCLSAVFKAGVYVLECMGLKAKPYEENGFKDARRLMWLLLLSILGTCVVGLQLSKFQSVRLTSAELTAPQKMGGERLQGDGAAAGVPMSAEK
jgi:Zn-dependent protease